jgi:hypothetical protein
MFKDSVVETLSRPLDDCHADYLIAYGISQDEYDFLELIAVGVFGYSLTPEPVPAAQRHDGRAGAAPNAAYGGALSLNPITSKAYKPICAFGGLGFFICSICVKMRPFDGRKMFCPIGEMY